jgi:NAD(P)-dependent dehydrogenase (short-subunit alcohol dehydrogenase family)
MTALAGRAAMVTGGTTGIGLAVVRRLLDSGCSVVVASRDLARGERVVGALDPENAFFRQTDVADDAAVASLVEATVERFGGLDLLFNNAGVEGAIGPMAAWSAASVDEVLAVNVKGAFLCMKHAAAVMAPGSVIVNTASFLGTIPMPLAAPYAASKAALLSLTRSAAAELAERSISVVAICPSVVDTPMMDRVSASAGAPVHAMAEMVSPSRQVTSPDRVADVVLTLFDGSSGYESGSVIGVEPEAANRIPMELTAGTRPG